MEDTDTDPKLSFNLLEPGVEIIIMSISLVAYCCLVAWIEGIKKVRVVGYIR